MLENKRIIVAKKLNYKLTASVNPVSKKLHDFEVVGPGAPTKTYSDILEAEGMYKFLVEKAKEKKEGILD